MFSTLVHVFLAFLAGQVAVAQNCVRQYTVQDGDFCDKISAANNVSTYQLAAVNSGVINSDCTNLVPGTVLCLANAGQDCQDTYVVMPGDDCDKVSYMANINTTILLQNNPQIDWACSNMYIKEVLCIANTVQVPPAPSVPVAQPPPTATPSNPDIDWCD